MIKIEFGMGIGLDRDGVAIPADRKRLGIAQIRDGAVRLFGGCTLSQTTGDWEDPATGERYCEEGIVLFVLTNPTEFGIEGRVSQLAETIKRSLNQKCVYVTRYPVESKLY